MTLHTLRRRYRALTRARRHRAAYAVRYKIERIVAQKKAKTA